MMDDYSNSVMLALLPVDGSWSTLKLPHLTLVYAGEIGSLDPSDFNVLAKDASVLALMNKPITLDAIGVEVYGQDQERVDVLTLRPTPELESMRHVVEDWDASEYPFNPHVTIGPPGSHVLQPYLPKSVTFNRVYVGWGDQSLTFSMT